MQRRPGQPACDQELIPVIVAWILLIVVHVCIQEPRCTAASSMKLCQAPNHIAEPPPPCSARYVSANYRLTQKNAIPSLASFAYCSSSRSCSLNHLSSFSIFSNDPTVFTSRSHRCRLAAISSMGSGLPWPVMITRAVFGGSESCSRRIRLFRPSETVSNVGAEPVDPPSA